MGLWGAYDPDLRQWDGPGPGSARYGRSSDRPRRSPQVRGGLYKNGRGALCVCLCAVWLLHGWPCGLWLVLLVDFADALLAASRNNNKALGI